VKEEDAMSAIVLLCGNLLDGVRNTERTDGDPGSRESHHEGGAVR